MSILLSVFFVLAGAAAPAVVASAADAPDRGAEFQRRLQMRSDAHIRQEFARRIEAMEEDLGDFADRIALLDIAPADLAWTLAAVDLYSKDLKAGNITAEGFLESPEHLLSFKLVSDVSAQPYSGATSLAPQSSEYENALFAAFASDLGPLAYLRDAVPDVKVEDLLWLHAVQHFDNAMLSGGEHTASGLLSMPGYWLSRKIVADAMVASMTNRVRCADPKAAYYDDGLCAIEGQCEAEFGTNMRACEVAEAVCEPTPFRDCEAPFNFCARGADCIRGHCSAGTVPQGCVLDCDVEIDSC